MKYRVAKSSDGRVLVIDSEFVASLINGRWFFEKAFTQTEELVDLVEVDEEEARRLIAQAREASGGGGYDFGGYSDYSGYSGDDDLPPDPSRVPKRSSPDGGSSTAQAVVEQDDKDVDETEET